MSLWPDEVEFHVDKSKPQKGEVFVFGSNLAGIHGRGAALEAKRSYGAVMLVGKGRTGHAYALPTKDRELCRLTLQQIRKHVEEFIEYAIAHKDERFFITRVGCGLAGYENREIAPMFGVALSNCNYPQTWKRYLKL